MQLQVEVEVAAEAEVHLAVEVVVAEEEAGVSYLVVIKKILESYIEMGNFSLIKPSGTHINVKKSREISV